MRVLLVEDDVPMAAALRRALKSAGVIADVAVNGTDAQWMVRAGEYDAVILDVMLPDVDGFETCRRLREDGIWIPILMLTARDAVEDRVRGLDGGADDYLVKPFSLAELLARLRALVRRGAAERPVRLEVGDLLLDPATRDVRRGERAIELTRTEFLLLELLMRHPRQVLTRSQIFERVWGYDFGEASNSLEVYVGYLRRKLEAGGEPRLLQTVRGVGYVLRDG